MKKLTLVALLLCALLCASAVLAEKNTTTAEIDLTFDGVTFTDTVQVEWEERYVVPEGGVKWDGTKEFVAFDNSTQGDIIQLENGSFYVDGQIIFTAKLESTFHEIEQIAARQDARIIGYIALTNSYAIEMVHDKSYSNLQNVIGELKKNNAIYEDSVCLNYAYESKVEAYSITDPWQFDFNPPLTSQDWVGRSELWSMSKYNWRAIAINAPKAWDYVDYMTPMNVGVVDAAFPEKHSDIDYALVEDAYYINQIEYTGSEEEGNREANHGTIIAGIIAAKHNQTGIGGIFPKGRIVAVGVFGTNNRKTFITGYTQTCAFAECINNGARVINISIGWESPHKTVNKEEINSVYNEFFENLRRENKEFLIVAAAGNEDTDTEECVYLAHVDNEYFQDRFVVVGGFEWGEGKPGFVEGLCWGSRVDILAPAAYIFSTCLSSYQQSGREYQQDIRGTSFAAPHVAGVAAMMWSINAELSGSKIKEKLLSHGETIIAETSGGTFKYPVLDAYACVRDVLGIGTVCGRVTIDIGIENVEIEVTQNEEHISTFVSGKNGEFCFDLPVGEYKIKVCVEGYNSVEQSIRVSLGEDTPITFDLMKETLPLDKGIIVCSVVDREIGTPLNASIALIPESESAEIILVNDIGSTGLFKMELDEGLYTVEIKKDGYIDYAETVQIEQNRKTTVNALLKWNNDGSLRELPEYYFTYDTVNDEYIKITGYVGPTDVDMVIPSYIASLPVKEIADFAFFNRTDLAGRLVLPDELEKIGAYAFGSFTEWMNFTNDLTIPSCVTDIGQGAFMCCCNFDGKLTLSERVEVIPKNTFAYCYGFTGKLVLPQSVKEIGDNSFVGCGNCSEIIILGDLDNAGFYAFVGCESLEIRGNVAYDVLASLEYGLSDDCLFKGYLGSDTERYANETGREFIAIVELETL